MWLETVFVKTPNLETRALTLQGLSAGEKARAKKDKALENKVRAVWWLYVPFVQVLMDQRSMISLSENVNARFP